jgi:hypothetical protein
MSLTDQVLAHALLLAGELTERQQMVLEALCSAATSSLNARLRDGLTAEDCKADFIASASLLALAALAGVSEEVPVEQIAVGDFSVKKGKLTHDAASNCLRAQAELMMTPYLKDKFSFMGV